MDTKIPDLARLTSREKVAAQVFGFSMIATVLWQQLGLLCPPAWLDPETRRIGAVAFSMGVVSALAQFCWKPAPRLSVAYWLTWMSACGMYLFESKREVSNYLLVETPLRYSQIVFSVAVLSLALMLFHDVRIPVVIPWLFVTHAVVWAVVALSHSNVQGQVFAGMINDLVSMFAYFGLLISVIIYYRNQAHS